MLLFDKLDVFDKQSFKNIKKTQCKITGKEFESCKFENCDFSEVVFVECKFVDCAFHRCNLRLTKLDRVSIVDTTFHSCNVSGIDFSTVVGIIRSFDFDDCQMKYAVFTGMELQSRRFTNSEMIECSFLQVNLKQSDFSGSNLSGTRFEDCDLTGSNFLGATNYFIDANSNKIKSAKFLMPEAAALLKNFDIIIEN